MGTNYTGQVLFIWYLSGSHHNPERGSVLSSFYRESRPLEKVSISPRDPTHSQQVPGWVLNPEKDLMPMLWTVSAKAVHVTRPR